MLYKDKNNVLYIHFDKVTQVFNCNICDLFPCVRNNEKFRTKTTQKNIILKNASIDTGIHKVMKQLTNTPKLPANKNGELLDNRYSTKPLENTSLKYISHHKNKQNYTKPKTFDAIVKTYKVADTKDVWGDNISKRLFKCACIKNKTFQHQIPRQKLKRKRKHQIAFHNTITNQNSAGDNESFEYSEKFKKMSANGLKKKYDNMQKKIYPYEEPKKNVRFDNKKSSVNLYQHKGNKNVKVTTIESSKIEYCVCPKIYEHDLETQRIEKVKSFIGKLKNRTDDIKFEKKPKYTLKDLNSDKSYVKKFNRSEFVSTKNNNRSKNNEITKHSEKKDIFKAILPREDAYNNDNRNKNISRFLSRCLHKLKLWKFTIYQDVEVQNKSDQTSDPLFEMQLNSLNMCILNDNEINDKVKSLGKQKSKPRICPPHGVRKKPIFKTEFRPTIVRLKALNDKSTKFLEIPRKYRDITDNINPYQKNNMAFRPKSMEEHKQPLFEIKLNSSNMCVINSKEIQRKLVDEQKRNNWHRNVVMEEYEKNKNHACQCNKIFKPYKFSKDTNDKIPLCTKCKQQQRSKMIRGNVMKSKLSCFCAQVISKSENWSQYNRKRYRRGSKKSLFHNSSNRMMSSQSTHIHKRNGLNIDINNKTIVNNMQHNNANKRCACCDYEIANKRSWKCTSIFKKSLSAFFNYPISLHRCECDKKRTKQEYLKIKQNHKKNNKRRHRKNTLAKKRKQWQKISNKDKKKFENEMRQYDKIKKKQQKKDSQKRIKGSSYEGNCLFAFLEGLINMPIKLIKLVFSIVFTVITKPRRSLRYIRDRIKDPMGTHGRIKMWIGKAWRVKPLRIEKTLSDSETINILTDAIKDSDLYQTFAFTGKSQKDKQQIEIQKKERKRRIRLRQNEALYSCRHMLLTTLRNKPCLCVYYICPNLYPQFLGLLSFMRSFFNLCLFLVAIACWTPCIICSELTRALCCCLLCTH
ncbi:uncharacterized protein PF3D7_1409500-like [Achroia grisella]|uniref:uncharacterized protein PF3D7_1409500-like n=1 Tax=Achroia grisella TaxID=688607 RepID=UPI0027D1EA04|nr:uncharacterized protein PF3D7_1409500-like [Achroia grisella]